MKFEEYMKKNHIKMTEEDKLIVFGEIKNKIQKESIFSRLFLYTKISVYSLLVFFIIFSLFLKTDKIIYKSDNITIKEDINIVSADYVGKVIKSIWEFTIMDNEKKIDSNIIKKWNIIFLWINSSIELKINEWIKLYLIWPAKLKIDFYNDENIKIYTLNMLDGNYISINSNSPSDKIILKSDFLKIESNDKFVDLKYEKRWNALIVENNGWNILVKNDKNVFSIESNEKIIMWEDNINKIKNILNDNYKKYKIEENGELKIILSSKELEQLWNILNKNNIVIAVWKYVLWKANKDERWEISWKKQLINIIKNTYNLLKIEKTDLFEKKLKIDDINVEDLEFVLDNLISDINKKYILIEQYEKRLKVILAYLVIIEKINIKEWMYFENISSLINYLKIEDKYKKVLLQF